MNTATCKTDITSWSIFSQRQNTESTKEAINNNVNTFVYIFLSSIYVNVKSFGSKIIIKWREEKIVYV